jgi:molybdopterin converting factor small subunit
VTVHIPSPLRDYTRGRARVEAHGETLAELLASLDAQFPGIRFRMVDEQGRLREHIKLFIGPNHAPRLDAPLAGASEVHIICAISGGRCPAA